MTGRRTRAMGASPGGLHSLEELAKPKATRKRVTMNKGDENERPTKRTRSQKGKAVATAHAKEEVGNDDEAAAVTQTSSTSKEATKRPKLRATANRAVAVVAMEKKPGDKISGSESDLAATIVDPSTPSSSIPQPIFSPLKESTPAAQTYSTPKSNMFSSLSRTSQFKPIAPSSSLATNPITSTPTPPTAEAPTSSSDEQSESDIESKTTTVEESAITDNEVDKNDLEAAEPSVPVYTPKNTNSESSARKAKTPTTIIRRVDSSDSEHDEVQSTIRRTITRKRGRGNDEEQGEDTPQSSDRHAKKPRWTYPMKQTPILEDSASSDSSDSENVSEIPPQPDRRTYQRRRGPHDRNERLTRTDGTSVHIQPTKVYSQADLMDMQQTESLSEGLIARQRRMRNRQTQRAPSECSEDEWAIRVPEILASKKETDDKSKFVQWATEAEGMFLVRSEHVEQSVRSHLP
jgi:hypothetical protein